MTKTAIVLSLLLLAHGCTRPAANRPTTRPAALTPGDYVRALEIDGLTRTYLVHVPPGYDAPPKNRSMILVVFRTTGSAPASTRAA